MASRPVTRLQQGTGTAASTVVVGCGPVYAVRATVVALPLAAIALPLDAKRPIRPGGPAPPLSASLLGPPCLFQAQLFHLPADLLLASHEKLGGFLHEVTARGIVRKTNRSISDRGLPSFVFLMRSSGHGALGENANCSGCALNTTAQGPSEVAPTAAASRLDARKP